MKSYRNRRICATALTAQPSRYLQERKLVYLRNAAMGLDRQAFDSKFFSDLGELVGTKDVAYALCAEAFKVDGRGPHGEKKEAYQPSGPDSRAPVNGDGISAFDFDDDDDDDDGLPSRPSYDVELVDRDGKPRGIFDRQSIADGLQAVWENTNGFDSLLDNVCELIVKAHDALGAPERGSGKERDDFRNRIRSLKSLAKLSSLETDILTFFYLFYRGDLDWFKHINTRPFPSPRGKTAIIRILSASLDADFSEVQTALSPDGALAQSSFLDASDFELFERISNYIEGYCKTPVRELFYLHGKCHAIPWEFFSDDLRGQGETIMRLIRSHLGSRCVNILLHGVPGAGKSSFAASLAERLALEPVSIAVGQDRTDCSFGGDFGLASFRLGALSLADRNCTPAKTLLVIDEADTMLSGAGANRLNDILDNGRCARVWITNIDPSRLAESCRRRFDFAIGFEPLGPRERLAIWRNTLQRLKLQGSFSDDELRDLADAYPVSAGVISRALENYASIAGSATPLFGTPEKPLLRKLLENSCGLLGIGYQKQNTDRDVSNGYLLDGLNVKGSANLPDILAACRAHFARLRDGDKGNLAEGVDVPRLNILLSGPPGSGKTEFVKYLGEQLGRRIRALSASDLLDMFVGQTEKKIAAAFREAERDGSVLFLDEVDSLLRNRADARNSWEVSQVNELLQRMEGFRGVMVAATNFLSSLDAAVLRRFTFKLSFGYLGAEGKRLFFQRFFKTPLTPAEAAELDAIPRLTPGDFRTVRQNLYYLGSADTNARRLQALRTESDGKAKLRTPDDASEDAARCIGF